MPDGGEAFPGTARDALAAPPAAVRYELVRSAFLRGLGLVHALAFLSLALQIDGLLGADGLAPAASFLARVQEHLGSDAYSRLPTVFWLGSSDQALGAACWAGTISGALLALGVAPLPTLFTCWVLYASLVSVGQVFLQYQWDALLLETTFLALFWCPLTLRLGSPRARAPSRTILWLLRWLTFRLMFFSGWVKLASGDPVWRNLTALDYHYQTQPLPAWTSWYAQQLPAAFQKLSCGAMFAIELALPFLIFCGRIPRAIACAGLVALQVLIGATGNYGFFNLLAIVLCIPLLDDRLLGSLVAGLRGAPAAPAPRVPEGRVKQAVNGLAAAIVLALSVPLAIGQATGARPALPAPVARLLAFAGPLHVVGGYGLFAVMTTRRPEILIEGSDDGETWQAYEFRWKPGPLDRAPRFVEPMMPRLDWQMWFDGLAVERMLDGGGRSGRDLVTLRLIDKLFAGSESVRRLLLRDPFDGRPPRYIRWQLYDYRFTDWAERRASGDWWKRTQLYQSSPLDGPPR